MRTDGMIDRRQVTCPNASLLGYGRGVARVGDWLTWSYTTQDGIDPQIHHGRMIGRVKYAPACGDTPIIKRWIEVLELSPELTHAYIRWIDPAEVTTIYRHRKDMRAFLSWFAGKLPTRDVLADTANAHGQTIEGMCTYGTCSADLADPTDSPLGTSYHGLKAKHKRYAEYRARATGKVDTNG